MGATARVFKVAGIPIFVHASWLAIYSLITWTLAVGYFPRVLPDLPAAAYWLHGLVAALLLFGSVLLHELSHSAVAIAHGLRVRGITLHVFGGVSHLEDEPPTPRAEFLIAVVGPLTSFAIAGVLWVLHGAFGRSFGAIAGYLVAVNLAIGVFNLIPGFPLDGGRILRAGLWGWRGSLPRATYLASRAGVGFAFALMAWGVFQMFGGAVVSGMWMVLIGLFLQNAANASYAQIALREALSPLSVRSIMARDVVSIAPETTVAELAEQFWAHHFTSFPVVDEAGVVSGIASVAQMQQVPQTEWPTSRVRQIMRPLDDTLTIAPADSVFRAMEKASTNGLGRLAVIDDGRLGGYLSMKDIAHVLALNGLGRSGGAVAGLAGARRRPLRRVA